MKPTLLTGPSTICHCDGCNRDGIGGSEPYESASSGETRTPEDWYATESGLYCSQCAARLVEEDPTRSRSRFYTDTDGTEIDPNI